MKTGVAWPIKDRTGANTLQLDQGAKKKVLRDFTYGLYAVTATVVVFMATYRALTFGVKRVPRSAPAATEPPFDRFVPADSRARSR